MKILDTHIHVWDFDKATYAWLEGNDTILNRTYTITELEQGREAAGVTEGILVQAANNAADTAWMLEVADKHDWIAGVVGWLPLMDAAGTARLLEEQYLENRYFAGVRHLIHDEPDSAWLLQPAVIDSLQVLAKNDIPFDIVGVLPGHIETVLKVAEKVPGLKMVFDHLNQPPIKYKEKFGVWGELMKQAAGHKNFYAKISGLGTASGKPENWTAADIKPYVAFVLEHFGTDRCFCGGDWPVSLLAGSYKKTWDVYQSVIGELLDEAQTGKILYDNAKQFYNV